MIIFISPYQELKTIADSFSSLYDEDIYSFTGDLYEGLKIAQKYVSETSCVFVSRGGTAKLINRILHVPVVEIGISFLDLLDNFSSLIGTSRKIAVVGFSNLTHPAESICNVLKIPVKIFTLNYKEQIVNIMDEVSNWGADIVIGDVVSVKKAKEYNLDYILIESGSDSVKEALDKAYLILKNTKKQLETGAKINAIFNSVSDAIVYINKNGLIEQVNQQFESVFDKETVDLHGTEIKRMFPFLNIDFSSNLPEKISGDIITFSGKSFALKTVPILINGNVEGMVLAFQKAEEIQDIEKKLRQRLKQRGLFAKYSFDDILFQSKQMEECIRIAKQYSMNKSSIILYGETGTGKELLAQSIHNYSPVRNGAFVAVNCAALSANLLESELFGYVEGAFTGASKGGRHGLFEAAHNGTLFLDEISEINIDLQTKLLRVLQEKEVRRIGDNKIIPVNTRIIVASNKKLLNEVECGRFRKDLYYRLNVLEINIPPLKTRESDISYLFNINIEKFSNSALSVRMLSPDFIKLLESYSWPGNIRELENMAEKFVILSSIDGTDFAEKQLESILSYSGSTSKTGNIINMDGTLKELEYRIICEVYENESRNISKAAKRLGIERNTLKRKLGLMDG